MYYYCIKTIISTPPPFSLDLVDYRHNVRIHCGIYRLFMAFVWLHQYECVNPLYLSINDGQSNSKKDSVFLISVKIKPKYEIGRMQ